MILKSQTLCQGLQSTGIPRSVVMSHCISSWNIPAVIQPAFSEYYMIQYTPQMVEEYVIGGKLTMRSGRKIAAFYHNCTRFDCIKRSQDQPVWLSIRTPIPEYELPAVVLIQPVGWKKVLRAIENINSINKLGS